MRHTVHTCLSFDCTQTAASKCLQSDHLQKVDRVRIVIKVIRCRHCARFFFQKIEYRTSLSIQRKQAHVLGSYSDSISTRASFAADNVSAMDAQESFECACYGCIVKPALVTQVHSLLTYALMQLVRLVFTLL